MSADDRFQMDEDFEKEEPQEIEEVAEEEEEMESGAPKALTTEDLLKFKQQVDKAGVVYLSHVPPFMKPIKLRQLLSQYAEIGRIYLAPEDAKVAARRKKYRGNKRQNYSEGWVEFMDKKVARSVATMLNAQPIGGKKRSFYYDDLWNLKYLPRFKWHHLTEQIAYERAVKEQRLRAEMSQARKTNKEYIKNVERAKMVEGIEDRKQKQREEAGESKENATAQQEIRRNFRQRKVVQHTDKASIDQNKVSVLSSIFS